MTLIGWLIFFLVVQVVHFLCTWKMYVAAGRKAWEASVPVYNAVILMKIINRPWWWVILLFVPIVNLIMLPVVWVETLRSFGYNSSKDTLLGVLTFGLYIGYVNYTQELKYIEDRDLKPRTSAGEWTSSILFAVVAATIVHTYFMQPFTIPTSSLEKTLLVGDYLFVSKMHYGARAPMTSAALPMLHDRVPFTKAKSYYSGLEYPYFRLPGFQKIKHNDIVVFSWPIDEFEDIGPPPSGYMYKPIDKKSNYVKRCVALPGDSLEVKNGYVYINGKQNELPDRAKLQFAYEIVSNTALVEVDRNGRYTNIPIPYVVDKYEISDIYITDIDREKRLLTHTAHITPETAEKLKSDFNSVTLIGSVEGQWDEGTFPQNAQYPWNNGFFGPIYIPKAGVTVPINSESIPFYKRIIEVYEGSELGITNTITQSGTNVLLNGQPLNEYTFKMDYYWMMGDNRSNSQDARSWGYVPFNHVVGKPVFVWMSLDKNKSGFSKIRWDRMFTTVGGDGEPVSYLKFFLIALGGWFLFSFFRKKKRQKAKS